jgi:hypothetical protein
LEYCSYNCGTTNASLLSGLPMKFSDTLVEKYKKGTKPEQDATQAE